MNIQENISLAPYTTFRIGGSARYFVSVSSEDEVQEALQWAGENNLRLCVLGGGSNVLVSDGGFDGMVILLEDVSPIVEGETIRAFAGTPLGKVVNTAIAQRLVGAENLSGVPGSVGGAVRGNAGAFGTEMKDVVVSVRAVDKETIRARGFSREECSFSYRTSTFKQDSRWIVASVEIRLCRTEKTVAELRAYADDIILQRNKKQKQDALCAGSFFINPVVKDSAIRGMFEKESGSASRGGRVPAGWFIDKVDMRGHRIGGAMVGKTHPNYIINIGGATAENVIMLASIVKQKVRNKFGVQLEQEVQMVGFE